MTLTGKEVLGIDAGTQGISIVLWCPDTRQVLGVGEAEYVHDYLPGLKDGRLEQMASYWSDAMREAMMRLRESVDAPIESVAGIGVTGHMHCMVRRNARGEKPWGCDMWNDPRGVAEGAELTDLFGEHIPARWTASHIFAAMRDPESQWDKVAGVNVASGSLVHDLTGEWVVGSGDASGMFGNLDASGQIDCKKLSLMDAQFEQGYAPLADLVPRVLSAGEIAGRLTAKGSDLLGGLPVGIPVAPPEGDQQSVLVGAGVDELELALSAGTSFSGNLPCSAKVVAESESVNVLSTPDAKTMLMVCARNGTVGFANYVKGLAQLSGAGFSETADRLTDLAMEVPADAYGATLLGFFQGENVAELPDARASLHGAGLELLANPGLMARLLLESPCMVMRYGLSKVEPKTGKVKRVMLTGGVLKSKGGYAPQLIADILGIPVATRSGDEEGTAKGAAVLAAYMAFKKAGNTDKSFPEFVKATCVGEETVWTPDPDRHAVFNQRYQIFENHLAEIRKGQVGF
ncbi:FGGY-family carbohydrate kinase [Kiritimatiellaeota bacterium B1221]|nr:FGGY-family carbohydrate kinase [Kiritimatiellaeota bacterium B1221]